MKTKNFLLALAAFTLFSAVFISCKKEDSPFTTTLSGTTFKGKVEGTVDMTFIFGNDTKLTVITEGNDVISGSETYTFSNNTVVGIFKFKANNSTIAFGGVMNADGTKITGSFGLAPSNKGLSFSVTKQ